eukprot:scaffold11429_cov19-Tisochrysis_lutea.AAC.1
MSRANARAWDLAFPVPHLAPRTSGVEGSPPVTFGPMLLQPHHLVAQKHTGSDTAWTLLLFVHDMDCLDSQGISVFASFPLRSIQGVITLEAEHMHSNNFRGLDKETLCVVWPGKLRISSWLRFLLSPSSSHREHENTALVLLFFCCSQHWGSVVLYTRWLSFEPGEPGLSLFAVKGDQQGVT